MDKFYNLCKKEKYNEVLEAIEKLDGKLYDDISYVRGMDHVEIIRYIAKKKAIKLNDGLKGACNGGHMKIVKLLIKKGANKWNEGLYGACAGGHMKIVKLMIKKGADKLNMGFKQACLYGHMKIVKLMIDKGANDLDCLTLDEIEELLYLETNIKTFINHRDYKETLKNIKKSQNNILQYDYQ